MCSSNFIIRIPQTMSTDNPSVIRHYFDWAASAVPRRLEGGLDKNAPFIDKQPGFGNPSSRHSEGRAAKEALENARQRCAHILGTEPETLYFTSGGTEANCIALYSNLLRLSGRIVSSGGEHPSVTENIVILQRLGRQTGLVPVDSLGRVSAPLLAMTLKKYDDVRFAAIMAVNNETGAINDISSIRRAMDSHEGPHIHFHCDMVQALGKIPVSLQNCDSAAISAHKLGGPRGIGLLYLKKPVETLYSGGGQEGKIRPGTENIAGALALACCMEQYANEDAIKTGHEQARKRMDRFISAMSEIERCVLIPESRKEHEDSFSPYILQLGFRDIPGEVMVRTLDDLGFAVSTGSACSSASTNRPVLAAMGIDDKTSRLGIRISQGWSTSNEEIELLIAAIQGVLKRL